MLLNAIWTLEDAADALAEELGRVGHSPAEADRLRDAVDRLRVIVREAYARRAAICARPLQDLGPRELGFEMMERWRR